MMKNYWLSNFIEAKEPDSSKDDDGMPDDEDPDLKVNLTPRQQALYDYYESIVEEFGLFDKSSSSDGAHYAPAKSNPFQKEGLICKNCVFFANGACELVKGTIESGSICKLWIIPKELLTTPK